MLKTLEQQKVVITGITGGIATATANLLLQQGAEVIVTARSEEKLHNSLAKLQGNVQGHAMDLLSEDSIKRCFSRIGNFDHLVTPAASAMFAPLKEMNFGAARELLESKQWGQLQCLYHALPYLRKDGSVSLFSGTVTQKPLPGSSIYASVGAATEAAGRVWALEQAPLRINTVVPGVIATDIWQGLLGGQEAAKQQLETIGSNLPAGRVGTAHDIAKAVYFLIDNTFVSGISLVVDGGHRLI